ncbi:MAG: aspartate--tRNA ligase, partial [Phycisphaerae bacterium]|nr:aspartate--tRNA ligase [Phycisphaerae bacterium]
MALPYNQRTCYCGDVGMDLVGQSAILTGWVDVRRDLGGIIFIDLRDRAGLVQLKFDPETNPQAHKIAEAIRNEYCIVVRGDVLARPPGLVNPKIKTGA